jgi:AcrR family transcriptional regulator
MMGLVLEAATRVLAKEGYEKATTNRIAEQAGISVGSLYQYFPSKDAILVALLARYRQGLLELVSSRLATLGEAPLTEVVPAILEAVLTEQTLDPTVHRLLVERVVFTEARTEVRDFEALVESALASALALRKQELRVKDTERAAMLVVRFVLAAAHAAIEEPERKRDPRFLAEVTDFVLSYLVGERTT